MIINKVLWAMHCILVTVWLPFIDLLGEDKKKLDFLCFSFKRHFPTNLMNVVYSKVRSVAAVYSLFIATSLKALCILVQIVVPDMIPNPSVFLRGRLWLDSTEVEHQRVLCLWRGWCLCVLDELWQQPIDWMAVKREQCPCTLRIICCLPSWQTLRLISPCSPTSIQSTMCFRLEVAVSVDLWSCWQWSVIY